MKQVKPVVQTMISSVMTSVGVVGLLFSMVACGKTAFNPVDQDQTAKSPGFFNVPPKSNRLND